jgi:Tol biopolymer transport system component/serine/threonine protein kinase
MTLKRDSLLHKRYRINTLLSLGGMGAVYRAVDENLGVEVAVKENFFTTFEYARQFRREAVILANLRHPSLPRVTDHFIIGEQGQYLVMDYIAGEDLRERMERLGAISEEDVILIGSAICEALTYLHTRKPPVIHRDVKPGNVRITPDGQVFLVDFGLAKVQMGSQTTTGARAMSPGYSPPEQYGSARTDPRTDIYSLGATLYAALTNNLPEDGLARVMDNVELTPIRTHNPKVSRRTAATVEKAMAAHADERYQSAEEFKQALLSYSPKTQRLAGISIAEPPPRADELDIKEPPDKPITGQVVAASQPPSQPPTPPASQPRQSSSERAKRRRKIGGWFASIAFLVILGMLAAFWGPLRAALTPPSPSPTNTPPTKVAASTQRAIPTLKNSPTQPTTEQTTATLTLSATPSPTAIPTLILPSTQTLILPSTQTPGGTATPMGGGYGQIAFASDRTGAPQIFLRDMEGNPAQQVTNLANGACQPAWSPDGLRIVFISPCLNRADLYPGASLFVINADGSGLTPLPTAAGGDFDPAWSPDGGRIAFTSLRDGSPQIYVMNLVDLAVTRLTTKSSDTSSPDQSRQPAWSPDGTQLAYTGRRWGLLEIWVMSDAGNDATQLVHSGSDYWDYLPAWSPDGATILFTQSSGKQALGWLMSIGYHERQGGDAGYVLNGISAMDAVFSPDGLWLAFESSDGFNFDIYVMGIDGKGRTRQTSDPAVDFDPAWRPMVVP